MLSLYIALVLLGLASIDPVGIAIMPLLLIQPKPYRRSFIFLGGSFASLLLMGLLFAKGFGAIIVHYESTHSRLVPDLEIIAGILLIAIAVFVYRQLRRGKKSFQPSPFIAQQLKLNNWQLFFIGAGIVAIQSIADVVFAVAMIRIGKLNLHFVSLTGAVLAYAVAALVLQLSVVILFKYTPTTQREKFLAMVQLWLRKYVNQLIMAVSLIIGCTLLIIAA